MTKQEYEDYVSRFESGSEGLKALSSGACPGCCEDSEPYFSWSPCEICRTYLGGDREPAHYLDDQNNIVHLAICQDCVYFMEYGCLDDQTMLDLEG